MQRVRKTKLLSRLGVLIALAMAQIVPAVSSAVESDSDALAAPPPFESVQLDPSDLVEAQRFVEKWIAENRAEARVDARGKKILQEVLIEHFGPFIPKSTRYIATALDKADFRVILRKVTLEDLEKDLEQNFSESRTLIRTLEQDSDDLDLPAAEKLSLFSRLKQNVQNSALRTKLFLRDLFGVPNGFTLFVKVNRDALHKKADRSLATKNALIGSITFTVALYLKDPANFHVTPSLLPIATFVGWVWLNMYQALWIGELQSQGRDVKRVGESFFAGLNRWRENLKSGSQRADPETQLKLVKKPLLQRVGVYGRSVLTNSLITAAKKIGLAVFVGSSAAQWSNPEDITRIFTNSLWTLFSRYAFEEWLASRQPRAAADGALVHEPGRFSVETVGRIRFWFEFFNGQVKWLHLFGVPYGDMVLPAMGVLGTINTLYDNRYWFQDTAAKVQDWVGRKLLGKPQAVCVTLLKTSVTP